MAYKSEILQGVNLTLQEHNIPVCTVDKVIGINTENKICLPNKGYMCLLIIKNKYGCQVRSIYAYYCLGQRLNGFFFFPCFFYHLHSYM